MLLLARLCHRSTGHALNSCTEAMCLAMLKCLLLLLYIPYVAEELCHQSCLRLLANLHHYCVNRIAAASAAVPLWEWSCMRLASTCSPAPTCSWLARRCWDVQQ